MSKPFRQNQRERIYAKSGGKCWYCGDDAEQIDHINPRFLGGRDNDDNLVPVCKWCNKSKRGKPLEEWRKHLALQKGLAFTAEQRQFWGVSLPKDMEYRFYFERMGLQS